MILSLTKKEDLETLQDIMDILERVLQIGDEEQILSLSDRKLKQFPGLGKLLTRADRMIILRFNLDPWNLY
jgi:hypothetical protein